MKHTNSGFLAIRRSPLLLSHFLGLPRRNHQLGQCHRLAALKVVDKGGEAVNFLLVRRRPVPSGVPFSITERRQAALLIEQAADERMYGQPVPVRTAAPMRDA